MNKKVLVIADGEYANQAKDNGAYYVGSYDYIEKIQGGWFEFDVVIPRFTLSVPGVIN